MKHLKTYEGHLRDNRFTKRTDASQGIKDDKDIESNNEVDYASPEVGENAEVEVGKVLPEETELQIPMTNEDKFNSEAEELIGCKNSLDHYQRTSSYAHNKMVDASLVFEENELNSDEKFEKVQTVIKSYFENLPFPKYPYS
ncbi:MAG: hypothetical protein QNK23_00930 [Crocinitomicaceae bacterium]|nr:hypothetical protein [Crocinitomicaceae bacterium]